MLWKKKIKVNLILLVFIVFSRLLFCENYTVKLEQAKTYYKQKEYLQAVFILEKTLETYPEYKAANILYLKTVYKLQEMSIFEKEYHHITSYEDKYKLDLLDFLISNNEIEKSEILYDSLENNAKIEDRFMKFLYEQGQKKKILEKYKYYKMIDQIEKDKKNAEGKYFEAIQALKSGNRMTALLRLDEAIELFPEEYIYFLKKGQIYADEKNFFLAERNFLKALNLQENDEIYLNMFRIYLDTNDEFKMYEIAKHILDKKEVKKVLKKIYYRQQNERKNVRIVRKENDKIYLDKRLLKNAKIGDAFYLQKDKETLYDMVTGEKLGNVKENIAKIRVYKVLEKVLVFQVLEKFQELDIKSNYIIKRERAYKY